MKELKKRICVFCGSRDGNYTSYSEKTFEFGKKMGQAGYDLVYGAGGVGLMKTVAEGFKAGGAHVIGFIPKQLFSREKPDLLYPFLDELIVPETISIRKQEMIDLSDAFCILPGGLGTFDEAFELLVLKQLDFTDKPMLFYNIDGFYDPLKNLLEHTVETGFAKAKHVSATPFVSTPEDAISFLTDKLK